MYPCPFGFTFWLYLLLFGLVLLKGIFVARVKIKYDFYKLAEAAYTGYVFKRKADQPSMAIHWSEFKDLSSELQAAWISAAKTMVKAAKDARK